jgi:hypothetical protein
MIDDDGAIGAMRIGRGNRNTRRKPAPVPLCPPQIPHDLTRARTRAAAVGRRQLTAWAMARPSLSQEIPYLYKTWGLITATECLVHTVMPYQFIYFNNIIPILSSHLRLGLSHDPAGIGRTTEIAGTKIKIVSEFVQ